MYIIYPFRPRFSLSILLRYLMVATALLFTACTHPKSTTTAPPTPLENAEPIILEPESPLLDWIRFINETDTLNKTSLEAKAIERKQMYHQGESPEENSAQNMQLAYILLRSDQSLDTLNEASALLNNIQDTSEFSPLRRLLQREINLTTEAIKATKKQKLLESQLKKTQRVLQKNKKEIGHLQTQLELLKAIDGDLLQNQKEINKVLP